MRAISHVRGLNQTVKIPLTGWHRKWHATNRDGRKLSSLHFQLNVTDPMLFSLSLFSRSLYSHECPVHPLGVPPLYKYLREYPCLAPSFAIQLWCSLECLSRRHSDAILQLQRGGQHHNSLSWIGVSGRLSMGGGARGKGPTHIQPEWETKWATRQGKIGWFSLGVVSTLDSNWGNWFKRGYMARHMSVKIQGHPGQGVSERYTKATGVSWVSSRTFTSYFKKGLGHKSYSGNGGCLHPQQNVLNA